MQRRVLVCGDRDWADYPFIRNHIAVLPPDAVVIHGACRGADTHAGLAARVLGLKVAVFPADWNAYGKAAGPIRNRKMLSQGKPDEVWAFHDHLSTSRGTRDMVNAALVQGVPVHVFRHGEEYPRKYPRNWFGVNMDGCSGS